MKRRFIGLTSALLVSCAPTAPVGPPIAASALCGEIADIVCDANATCCRDRDSACVATQTATCEETLGRFIEDPRLAYVPEQGGLLLEQLEARAAMCWSEPFRYDEIASLFEGTGTALADCTPIERGGTIASTELQLAALSCSGDTSCRIHLGSDNSAEGVCERRATSGNDVCSHAFDCPRETWCNLSSNWRPGDWGRCQPLRANGWACGSGLECESGYCGRDGCTDRPETERCLSIDYPALVNASEPVAYWRLGERSGLSASDESTFGNDGAYVEPIMRRTDGAIMEDDDGALTLSGMNGRVELSTLDGFTRGSSFTFEFWVEKPMMGGGPLLELVKPMGASLRVQLDGARIVASFLGATDMAATDVATPTDAIGADFNHIAITYDGSHTRLYVNGARVTELAGEREIPVDGALTLGFRNNMDPMMRASLTGSLDEFAVYDQALAPAVLMQHFRAGREGAIENEFVLFAWTR